MCESPRPSARTAKIAVPAVLGILAATAVTGFVMANAAVLIAAAVAYMAVMGGVLALMRQPDWHTRPAAPEQFPALPAAPPARAIAGQREILAIEAPAARWACRDPGLDRATRERADEILAEREAGRG